LGRADDIAKTADGDALAFRRVVETEQGRVFCLLGRIGLDAASAEDIAQETFLRIWRHAHRYDRNLSAPTTWIFAIARNAALDWLHRRNRRREVDGALAPPDAVADDPAPDEALIAAERRQRLGKALQRLAPGDRALLAASYFDELSLADIAEIEGCSAGAAKLRLHRARARLREILEADDA
jgi:RNA polymerase sigma-70 factor, ECF subfamily